MALVLGDVTGESVLTRPHSGVPDRRRVRLAALRLRRAAGRGDGGHRGRGSRRAALTRAGMRAAAWACSASCRPTSCRDAWRGTVDAKTELGLPVDAREILLRADVRPPGAGSVRLLRTTRPRLPA